MTLEDAMDGARAKQSDVGELLSQGAGDGRGANFTEGAKGEFAAQAQDVKFDLRAGAIEAGLGPSRSVLEVGLGERLAVGLADPILERRQSYAGLRSQGPQRRPLASAFDEVTAQFGGDFFMPENGSNIAGE
ncbi:MAG: hypothetical protein JSR82_23070 [Verrucomicrobia bacterium]|nr:hypothetical protein [Verrucomicrobiota bacterium]